MEKIKHLFLYFSAFVPMYFLIFIRLVLDMINHNLHFNVLNSLNFATLILLIGFGCFGLYWNVYRDQSQAGEIIILEKENITDRHFLGYFSLFVLFALQLDLSFVSGYIVYLLILIFIGIVYIKNNLYYINPLLNILGYNFYNITYSAVGSDRKQSGKIFYKGELAENKTYWVKVKNDNFAFVDRKKRN